MTAPSGTSGRDRAGPAIVERGASGKLFVACDFLAG